MSELFALTGQYNQLLDMMTDEEVDEEVLNDTLSAVLGEIEVKSESYLAIINRLDMEVQACEKHLVQWQNALRVRKNAKERLKKALVEAMMQLDVTELKAGDQKIKLVNNGGKQPIRYRYGSLSGLESKDMKIDEVPKEYRKTIVTETVDGDKVRETLESGEKLDWAYLCERGKSIRVK